MPTVLICILIIVTILIILSVTTYNSLIKLNERVKEAWSDITVQLKRRSDLIPNIIETVKGYAKHESETFSAVTDARAKITGARSISGTVEADKNFTNAVSRLMAVAESYPELKANTNFQQLSSELSDTEDKIQAARRFYNTGVKDFNTKLKTFPTSLINKIVGHFKEKEFYEVDMEERDKIQKAPEVKF